MRAYQIVRAFCRHSLKVSVAYTSLLYGWVLAEDLIEIQNIIFIFTNRLS